MPSTFHIVLASRAEPPLPLARWRLANTLNELRVADLRFNQTEASSLLLQALQLPPTHDTVAALVDRTEGWVAGLRFAARFAPDNDHITGLVQSFGGGHRDVQDYLEEEVLGLLPADIQAFLLRTSVLDRLCASLCDAVVGTENTALNIQASARDSIFSSFSIPNAQFLLEVLERAGLFLIPLDTERTWYRYHALFAEALRYRLDQEAPALAMALRQRAAAWYAEHGVARIAQDATLDEESKQAPINAAPVNNASSVDLALSNREQDVLRLLTEGCSNQDIAATLIIGVNTVKMHVKHLYAKLDAHNRTQAVAHARKLGLV